MTTQAKPTCPHCGGTAELVGGDTIYPHRPDLYTKQFWLCEPCWAYAGNLKHRDYDPSKIFLANADLRAARQRAHKAFDWLWETTKTMSRTEAYAWLAQALKMDPKVCHIGMFTTVAQCDAVVTAVSAYRQELLQQNRPKQSLSELQKLWG